MYYYIYESMFSQSTFEAQEQALARRRIDDIHVRCRVFSLGIATASYRLVRVLGYVPFVWRTKRTTLRYFNRLRDRHAAIMRLSPVRKMVATTA